MNTIPLRDIPVIVMSNVAYEQSIIRQFLRQMRAGSITMTSNGVDALRYLREEIEQILICRHAADFNDGYRLFQFINLHPALFAHIHCKIIYTHDTKATSISKLADLKLDGVLAWPLSFNAFRTNVERPFNPTDPKPAALPPADEECFLL